MVWRRVVSLAPLLNSRVVPQGLMSVVGTRCKGTSHESCRSCMPSSRESPTSRTSSTRSKPSTLNHRVVYDECGRVTNVDVRRMLTSDEC
ncbi:hypothetical protein T484DRAFT_3487089 [Baffinella frigidus]|nr:hypothetical protein T484DRAFT_3487089 [Cryptophyta sp. CCMP2293]